MRRAGRSRPQSDALDEAIKKYFLVIPSDKSIMAPSLQTDPATPDCPAPIPSLETIPNSIGRSVMRCVHYFQARVGNRFAGQVRFLSRYIPAEAVVFDVGGNLGRFSRSLALRQEGRGMIYCFEPLPYNHSLARKALRRFKNVKVFSTALSAESGTTSFFVPVKKTSKRIGIAYGHMGHLNCEKYFAAADDRDVYQVNVPTETLDRVMAQERLGRLDFLKVDVEGAEGLVFRGGLDSIARFKPAIYCEIAPGFPERVGLTAPTTIAPLLGLGYHMFIITAGDKLERCHECLPGLENYLFLHPENPHTMLPVAGR
jgi:FkbM family methyltransferase